MAIQVIHVIDHINMTKICASQPSTGDLNITQGSPSQIKGLKVVSVTCLVLIQDRPSLAMGTCTLCAHIRGKLWDLPST